MADASVTEAPDESRNVPSIFVKIRKCRFFGMGACTRGDQCSFAHMTSDLRPAPDFRKTKLCPIKRAKGSCTSRSCTYAHTAEELRKVGFFRAVPPAESGDTPKSTRSRRRGTRTQRKAASGNASRQPALTPGMVSTTNLNVDAQSSDTASTASGDETNLDTPKSTLYGSPTGTSVPSIDLDDSSEQETNAKAPAAKESLARRRATLNSGGLELHVKNTFVTDDCPRSPLVHRLRRVRSEPCIVASPNEAEVEADCEADRWLDNCANRLASKLGGLNMVDGQGMTF